MRRVDETLSQDDVKAFHNIINLLAEAGAPFEQFQESWAGFISQRLQVALTNQGPVWEAQRGTFITLARRVALKLGERSADLLARVEEVETARSKKSLDSVDPKFSL